MIDDHVHPFPLAFEQLDLAGISLDVELGEAAGARRRSLAGSRLFQHLLQSRLARLLGVEFDEAVAARDERAATDWPGWVRRLFVDADISGMVLDEATHPAQPPRTSSYADIAGVPIWEMTRIDPLVDDLLAGDAGAAEIVAAVEETMATAAERGCVAFKTILAYRTGLAVDPTADVDTADRQLVAEARDDVPVRRRGKAVRDLVLRRVMATAAELGKPLQIHTGYGDSELRLGDSHPLLLEDLLRTPEGSAATVVLIHGSFPWHAEAAHLAATRANVWVELSLSNLFAPAGTAQRMLGMLDVAPAQRILVGSDGHGAPETHWFGCQVLVDAWAEVERRLTDAGAAAEWLTSAADAIFERNARELYALG